MMRYVIFTGFFVFLLMAKESTDLALGVGYYPSILKNRGQIILQRVKSSCLSGVSYYEGG